MIFWSKMGLFLEKHSKKLLVLAIVFFALFLAFLSLRKLDYFAYNAFDLSIFNQVFYNTLHGRWFEMTINLNSYLADHFTPIIILFLPFYALWPKAEGLLILQSFILAFSAWPIYLISRHVLANKKISFFIALAWLFNPFVHSAHFYEFHLLPIAVLFIFWAFYFYQKEKFKYFILFFILSLLVREDVALILLGFPFLAILEQRKKFWVIPSLVLALCYFFLSLKIIGHFDPSGSYKFFIYYSWLGGHSLGEIIFSFLIHPLKVLQHIFSLQNMFNLAIIFWPFLFFPFLKPKYFIFFLLPLLQIIMTGGGFSSMVYQSHYILFFLPGLFFAFIFSFQKIIKFKNKSFIYLLLFVTVIYLDLFLSPVKQVFLYPKQESFITAKQEMIKTLGSDKTLAVSASFLPALSTREKIYAVNYSYFAKSQFAKKDFILPDVDYILLDYSDFIADLLEKETNNLLASQRPKMNDRWKALLDNYHLEKIDHDLFLFSKKTAEDQEKYRLLDFIERPDNLPNKLILNQEYIVDKDVLSLEFNPDFFAENYLIRFYAQDFFYDLPLDYALISKAFLDKQKVIKLNYYLSSEIKAYQVFSWSGENKLGLIGEVVPDLQIKTLNEKISL
ncbi:DUF2079 domain-containing protein [Candidatus Nomurabacteria bacterium]|nr:DUF2079 domain-containing protein [Candidatus Nomurabacteria bacterium]